jgi:hypothetical protein
VASSLDWHLWQAYIDCAKPRMPVELWFECICSSTRFGQELLIVGSIPELGSWRPEKGVALRTSAKGFPRWTLEEPLRLPDPPTEGPCATAAPPPAAPWIEYKYVVHDGRDGYRWEDLGTNDMPIFSSTSSAFTNNMIARCKMSKQRPINRRLPGDYSHLQSGPMVLLRLDRFEQQQPAAEASWSISSRWGPEIAGCDAALGPCRCRWNRPPCGDLPAEWLNPGSGCRSVEALARRVFAEGRRAGIHLVLAQLARRHNLPSDLLRRIMEVVNISQEPLTTTPSTKTWRTTTLTC